MPAKSRPSPLLMQEALQLMHALAVVLPATPRCLARPRVCAPEPARLQGDLEDLLLAPLLAPLPAPMLAPRPARARAPPSTGTRAHGARVQLQAGEEPDPDAPWPASSPDDDPSAGMEPGPTAPPPQRVPTPGARGPRDASAVKGAVLRRRRRRAGGGPPKPS